MMVLRHPRLGRRHLPPKVAANSGKVAVIVAATAPVGATGLLQTARSAPEPLMPVPLRHRAIGDAPAPVPIPPTPPSPGATPPLPAIYCNPHTTPAQLCPSDDVCPDCGRNACLCT